MGTLSRSFNKFKKVFKRDNPIPVIHESKATEKEEKRIKDIFPKRRNKQYHGKRATQVHFIGGGRGIRGTSAIFFPKRTKRKYWHKIA